MSTDLTISLAAIFVSDPEDHPLKIANHWTKCTRGLTSLSLITELANEERGYMTREAILKRCFTDADAEELFDLCRDDITLKYMRDLEKIVDPKKKKDEITEKFQTVAREFFREIPERQDPELPREASLTWDTVLEKVRDARGALNALRVLQTLGADGNEVVSNLRETTTDLDEQFPESWVVSHGSDGRDSDIE